jgi:hypothetical protein
MGLLDLFINGPGRRLQESAVARKIFQGACLSFPLTESAAHRIALASYYKTPAVKPEAKRKGKVMVAGVPTSPRI